jgi:hypothetical protein
LCHGAARAIGRVAAERIIDSVDMIMRRLGEFVKGSMWVCHRGTLERSAQFAASLGFKDKVRDI